MKKIKQVDFLSVVLVIFLVLFVIGLAKFFAEGTTKFLFIPFVFVSPFAIIFIVVALRIIWGEILAPFFGIGD